MDEVLRAVADPTRRQILELVRDAELSAGDIAARFAVTRSAISQHLAVLRGAGLVTERRDGARRIYRARPDGTRELQAWLNGFGDPRTRVHGAARQEEHDGTDKRSG